MPKAMARGSATRPTVMPARRSCRNICRLYWRRDTTSLGRLGLLMDMIAISILGGYSVEDRRIAGQRSARVTVRLRLNEGFHVDSSGAVASVIMVGSPGVLIAAALIEANCGGIF